MADLYLPLKEKNITMIYLPCYPFENRLRFIVNPMLYSYRTWLMIFNRFCTILAKCIYLGKEWLRSSSHWRKTYTSTGHATLGEILPSLTDSLIITVPNTTLGFSFIYLFIFEGAATVLMDKLGTAASSCATESINLGGPPSGNNCVFLNPGVPLN